MTEVDRIKDQLRRAFQGEAWHGPSLMELISDIDAAHAAAKPLPRVHSIWELVNHIAAWEDAVRRRIEGEAVELSGDKDWPPVRDSSPAAWKAAIEGLERGHEALAHTVARLDDAKLLGPVPGREYNVYFLVHGVIQHDLY